MQIAFPAELNRLFPLLPNSMGRGRVRMHSGHGVPHQTEFHAARRTEQE